MKNIELFQMGSKVPMVPLKGGMEPEPTVPDSDPFYPLGAELGTMEEIP